MFMFFGDSHSRQFRSDLPGEWGHMTFSGATIKGLESATSRIKHGETIKYLSVAPFPKTLFIMLGAVDIDVTYYRKIALGENLDDMAFFAELAIIYRRYLDGLAWAGGHHIEKICVLAPQVTPLRDDVFVHVTAQLAKVTDDEIRRVVGKVDCSHSARCKRQIVFNNTLSEALPDLEARSFHRIDMNMTGEDGCIAERFIGSNPLDHHSIREATFPLWQEKLQYVVPRYKRAVEKRTRLR